MTQAMAYQAWLQLIMHRANRHATSEHAPHLYQLQAVVAWPDLYQRGFSSKGAYNHAIETLRKQRETVYPPTHP